MSVLNTSSTALIATLGSEPQVISATIDLLKLQSVSIDHLTVVHTTSTETKMQQAVNVLREEYRSGNSDSGLVTSFIPITDDAGNYLPDVETPLAIRDYFKLIYQLIRKAKQDEVRVHILSAGGRKTMALFAMAAAQMLFDDQDRFWYLHSSSDYLSSRRLHPIAGDEVSLVPIPVLLWSQISPAYTHLGTVDDPFQALEHIKTLRLDKKIDQARIFVMAELTAAERRVVEMLVTEGLSDKEISERLFISPRTVEQHLRSTYQKAVAFWGLLTISRTQLVAILHLYYSMRNKGNSA